MILIYCRSSVQPQHQWPVSQKLFTLDVMYLHDKPGPDNCPQEVYDALVDTLEHVLPPIVKKGLLYPASEDHEQLEYMVLTCRLWGFHYKMALPSRLDTN
ncbi:hypothetical protein NC652_039552 [Populus alba x Populus x berolinensis]|nr:hypothetical protein NC652_039552 [Populus alba x Populus x berolinensis]